MKKFDAIVICSTLNQMVNYIAIQEHGIKNIYNITMKEKNYKFNQKKWNENLEEVLKLSEVKIASENVISYERDEISNHKNIIKKLEENFGDINGKYPMKKESILWNITGGQRHFVMAITEYVYNNRPKDVILYYEGDCEEMYYYSKNPKFRGENIVKNKEPYPMTIPIALKLMGFEVSERSLEDNSKYYKFLSGKEKNENIDAEYTWYTKFYNVYEKNEKLRLLLINSNRFQNDEIDVQDTDNKKTIQNKKIKRTVLDKIIKDIEKHVKSNEIIDSENCLNDFTVLKKSIGNHNRGKVFGYILEKMTLYRIMHILGANKELISNVADIDISVKIKGDRVDLDKKIVDEFDILILTKKGKVIMLECKSGGMTGDNAKSHNYSTYAVAGVYGTPILISPIDNREKVQKFESKVEYLSDKEKMINEDVYQYLRSSGYAAEKANIETLSIEDKIEDKIEEKLKDLLIVKKG